jgi:hypothetical protein
MKTPILKVICTTAVFTAVIATGLMIGSQRGRADSDNDSEESKIKTGFAIAPVDLNLKGKNRSLVGLGSYIVNAVADCNGCHDQGPPSEFAAGGNPYFGQHPTKINKDVYLGGGRSFGALIPGSAVIISRNLTPDKTGTPEGGVTFDEFVQIMRHGTDLDKWHPPCTGAPNANCIPKPFDGTLLQVMPWPIDANMTDHDLRAIYEYLSAIPCIEGDPGNPAGADTHGHRCK